MRHLRDWRFDLLDSDLDLVGPLDEIANVTLDVGPYGMGKLCLPVHLESTYASELASNDMYYVKSYRDGVWVADWRLGKDKYGYTATKGRDESYINIILEPLAWVLKGKSCEGETAGSYITTPELPIDDAMKWLVDRVCGPNAYASRADGGSRSVSGLTIQADASAHATSAALTAHREDLFDVLHELGAYYAVNWWVELEVSSGIRHQMVFKTALSETDRTYDNRATRQPVIINDASGNLSAFDDFRDLRGTANVIISKDGETEVEDAASVTAYGRREYHANTDSEQELARILEQRKPRVGVEVEFNESDQCKWMDDFDRGDVVTVNSVKAGRGPYDLTVRMVSATFDEHSYERLKLILGYFPRDLSDAVREAGGGSSGAYIDPLKGIETEEGDWVPFSGEPDYQRIYFDGATEGDIVFSGEPTTNTVGAALTETGVTAGTYGDSTHVATFTVDAKGRLSAAGEAAISAGVTDHGALTGLGDDDHSQYLLASGARSLTGAWNAGQDITATAFKFAAANYIDDGDGDDIRLYASGDVKVVTGGTQRGYFGTIAFVPQTTGGYGLGVTSLRWGGFYGTSINVTDDITIGTGKGVVHADGNTAGKVLRGNGTRFVPGTLDVSEISNFDNHDHDYDKATRTGTFTAGTFRNWIEVYDDTSKSNVIGYVEGVEHWHDNASSAWTYTSTATGVPN